MKRTLFLLLLSFCIQVVALAQQDFYGRLADSALTLTHQQVQYDPAYFKISYPNGDVPADGNSVSICRKRCILI